MKIRLSNITKAFGNTVALEDFSIDVENNEFLVILGPSGCGKTTALRIIAGLEQQDSGKVYFDEENVDDLTPGKRNIAMVFQNFALYPHRTVRGNIGYPLRVQKKPKKAIEEAVQEIARLLSIDHLLDRFPRQLSTGEAQRVGLARAMIRRPRCFLFDEPLSNLDAQLRIRMRAELREIHDRHPITTIYVTHDQEEASVLADRIVIIQQGHIMQIGSPHEVYFSPCCRFVAGFIGSPQMNFVPALLRPYPQYSILEIAGRSLQLPVFSIKGNHRDELQVDVGVRPEDLMIAPPNTREESNEQTIDLLGAVKLLQVAEPDLFVHVDIADQRIVVRCKHNNVLSIGEGCVVWAPLNNIHIFDQKNGMRLIELENSCKKEDSKC